MELDATDSQIIQLLLQDGLPATGGCAGSRKRG
jgi:hypothetical protein